MKLVNYSKKLLVFATVLLIAFLMFFNGAVRSTAFASTDQNLSFDESNVLDDLKNSTINGKTFSLADYPFDEKGKPTLISFLEYCYSYRSSQQDYYGLYIYIYNPQGVAFDTASSRNKIQMRFGSSGNFDKYNLQYVNHSTKAGFEGLFYKFKVVLSATQKNNVLKTLAQANRIYEISGFEISVKNQVTEYTVALKYNYSGYAKGYGPETANTSTLSCLTDGIKDVLTLKVTPTYFRPEGTNGKNIYTQDSLHSVYFSVPNEFINKYGEMSAVHATWLNAVLKPSLVIGYLNAFNAIKPHLGKTTASDCGYNVLGDFDSSVIGGDLTIYHYGYGFNEGMFFRYGGDAFQPYGYDKDLSILYMLYYSGSAENSADTYFISSEDIMNTMLESKTKFGGTLVNEKYSRAIFESVDSEFTDINIERNSQYNLTDELITQNWWQKLWGTGTVTTNTFDGIKAIHTVDMTKDLSGTDPEISNRLFITEKQVPKFKEFCETSKKNNETVYLFRYQVSDYIAQEAIVFRETGKWLNPHETLGTNAYFFQQTVNLDFDIIDVTFTKDNVSTIIPNVMSPIDIIHDATPPVYTEDDEEFNWKLLIAIIAVIILLIVCMPVLPYIIKFLLIVVTAPVKLIDKLIKAIKKKKNLEKEIDEKEENKE